MKTRIIIVGIMVAVFSTISVTRTKAQQAEPAIKIVPTKEIGMIKIIYAYKFYQPVKVKFSTLEGEVKSDEIKGEGFDKGFSKKYQLLTMNSEYVWVEISSAELSATFKLKEKNGKWQAELTNATYNYPSVAMN